MSEQKASRREFLVHAAVGAGAVAGAGLVPNAPAQNEQHKEANAPSAAQHGAFFNHDDAATMAAFAERAQLH